MDQPACHLDQIRRGVVLQAIPEVCGDRGWNLPAAHVRSNHVHTVVEAETEPERVMNDFKAYASRRLTRMSLDDRTGSDGHATGAHDDRGNQTRLWKPQHASAAIQYVVAEQIDTMSACESHES